MATAADLVDVPTLLSAYHSEHPDPEVVEQRVVFGTSGHRGSSLNAGFNEDHIAAITQAVCEQRARAGITGPLFLGRDTHALSEPAFHTALEVLAANDITVLVDSGDGFTPTPAVSHAILAHNRGRTGDLADGITITPSHNPPEDGGFKYNPPHGGPAESGVTDPIQSRANELLAGGCAEVRRVSPDAARDSGRIDGYDFLGTYVADLPNVIDIDAIRDAGIRIGVDPLGGASLAYWEAIRDRLGLDITVVNPAVDPTFRFMSLDSDGKIRMDCSSAYAMKPLIERRDEFDLAIGNDPDADRHGVVTAASGLLEPNKYLAVAVDYLCRHRTSWAPELAIGRTLVTTQLIDRIAAQHDRPVLEVPVGFKWFVPGLTDRQLAFGGEESAGATFVRRDGGVWTTDKDGIILGLLAAEIQAVTGISAGERYGQLTEQFGEPRYRRITAAATKKQQGILRKLDASQITADSLAGEPVLERLTHIPDRPDLQIGGLKVVTKSGWFTARPSGTEDVYKVYAESFADTEHLDRLLQEAQEIVDTALTEQ